MDMLLFQKEEIEAAELPEGEEDALLEQKKRLSSMERLIRLTGESVTLLYDGDDRAPSACDQLGDALRNYGKRRNMMRLCLPWRMHWRMAMLPWRTARGN